MKLPRRRDFLLLAVGAAALPFAPHVAKAQAYPTRPVHVVAGFPAGSAPDILARLMGECLSERLGQPFITENRPGAAGNIATEAVVRASPDGHTLLLVVTANTINVTLYDKLNFNFIRDIIPVASIVRNPLVMEVNPSLPVKTVPEFIAYAKTNPGKLSFASTGNGSTPHICAELFKTMTGVDMVHVPYRGSPQAVTDLIGGQVQVMFDIMAASIEYIRTGKARALAVTTAARQEMLPDIPTVGEFVAGYEASGWAGIGAPRNTPAEIVEKLNKEVNAALAEPRINVQLAKLGAAALALSPAEFRKLIADETEKWGKVIRTANIKPE